MSNLKYLNDSNEFIEGKNNVIEFVELYINRLKNKNASHDFIRILNDVKDKLTKDISRTNDFFICSFSTDADDLSQWRAYGKNGSGICLEFEDSSFHLGAIS